MTLIDYIAEHCWTLPSGHTTWSGDVHPRFKHPVIPAELSNNGKPMAVASYLYGYWRLPDHNLRFGRPSCGLPECLVSNCQTPYDVPRQA